MKTDPKVDSLWDRLFVFGDFVNVSVWVYRRGPSNWPTLRLLQSQQVALPHTA